MLLTWNAFHLPLLAAIRDLVSREPLRALISRTTREKKPREVRDSFSRELDCQYFRGQNFFLILSIVYVNQKFFLKLMLISVIFLSYLTCFVTRSCNKTRSTTRRPEGNRSGSLETKWEESVSNYHIIQSILCVQLTTDGIIRFFGYFSNYSYELKH